MVTLGKAGFLLFLLVAVPGIACKCILQIEPGPPGVRECEVGEQPTQHDCHCCLQMVGLTCQLTIWKACSPPKKEDPRIVRRLFRRCGRSYTNNSTNRPLRASGSFNDPPMDRCLKQCEVPIA